ncbi:hypothetical protein C8F04DRAFT_1145424 [Mycena alexandri]|uniref:NACHT domain-containing protein n=1 Tax=Mycena alexandri TaxID=1745969 RepID=A0AAD6S3V4_9AGAR|nr:hypothetical protein C8F04DRAFT_1145424 [Mycena alexandri]
MFSGTQMNGGTFYNVQGDINVHSYQHQHWALHGASAPWPLELGNDGAYHHHLAIEDRIGDPMPQLEFEATGGETERVLAGATRNPRHHATAGRHAPYERSRRPTNSMYEEIFPESSSLNYPQMGYRASEPHVDPGHHNPNYAPDPFAEHSFRPQDPRPNPPPSILGGAHISAQNVNHYSPGETGINILHRSVALEALYDSADSYPQPRCHPETRTKMLDKLDNWCTENNSHVHPICWLHGPAGAGKSAIMQTLSRQLQDTGRLGAAFFFKRLHPTRGNAKVLFATLAHQLAENHGPFRPVISQVVERYPSIVQRDMEVQLRHLIIDPCQTLTDAPPPILLIDGLDECQDEHIQQQILRLIGHTVCQCPTGIRFLVASRPESHIREIIEDSSFDRLLTSVNVQRSFNDVRTYLQDEFARIHREHPQTMKEVQTPWPSPEILDDLVEKSSGYFVYASTVIKFVDDPYFRPTERLEIVQNLKATQYDAPFAALDQLYIQILSGVPAQFRSRLCDILQCVVHSTIFSSKEIDHILGLRPGDAQLILRGLHSLLEVPPYDKAWPGISFHHASFLDFLQAQERSSNFHLGVENRMNVTRAILGGTRWVSSKALVKCITSVPPSSELVPFVARISSDFRWPDLEDVKSEELLQVVTWLKETELPPRDLIQRWHTYYKMALWETIHAEVLANEKPGLNQSLISLSPQMLHVLHVNMSSSLRHPVAEYWPLVAQSSGCIRLLQAAWLAHSCTFACGSDPIQLHCLQPLLDKSWDGMMDSISVLPTIISEGKASTDATAIMMTILTLSLEFFPASAPAVSGDLACSCLRLIKEGPSQLPYQLAECWGKLIRCSPHSNPELLGTLCEFTPPWNEYEKDGRSSEPYPLHPVNFHDVLQWLNAHPDKYPELITRWQSYLDKSISVYPFSDGDVSTTQFEAEWLEMLKYTVDFNATPHGLPYKPLDEEEVIHYFQHIIEPLSEESDQDMDI